MKRLTLLKKINNCLQVVVASTMGGMFVQSTSGSSIGECDDVTTSRGSRARRPARVYDWNTKQHFYPDFVESDDWTGQFVRWNSARWRQQGSSGASRSSCVQQTVNTTTSVNGESHERRSKVVPATPFRRSQFVSLSWSEKRGRQGRPTRRGRRRLSDPYQDDIDLDAAARKQTSPATKLPSNASVFCRSDWKRQVSTSRSKDGGVDERSAVVSRWAQLKQIASRERARRRREFVRQRCRRYGWEPFSVEETTTTTTTTTTSQQADYIDDMIDTGEEWTDEISDTPAGV